VELIANRRVQPGGETAGLNPAARQQRRIRHMVDAAAIEQNTGAQPVESTFRDNRRWVVEAEWLYDVLKCLRDDHWFDMLVDITAVDYLETPDAADRYGVVYPLLNTETGERLIVKTFVNDPDPELATVTSLWRAADWMEREVYDMFGIRFRGHPDPRRILMPDEFVDFPLRKDYPLKGRGERHNFPVITRAES
jgi:NADH-quinone oxidoreductase subunit C